MSAPDEELARDLEGLLEPSQASDLAARLERDPDLRRARDELERILAGPLRLEPVEVPESLEAWVAERAARAPQSQTPAQTPAREPDPLEPDPLEPGELEAIQPPDSLVEFVRAQARAASSSEERDPLAEPLQLEPVPVPASLEAWARDQVSPGSASGSAPGSAEAPEREGRVLAFPPALGWVLAAALLLLSCGLGLWGLSAQNAAQRSASSLASAEDTARVAREEAGAARQAFASSADSLQRSERELSRVEEELGAKERELRELELAKAQLVAARDALEQDSAKRRRELEGQLSRARTKSVELSGRLAEREAALAKRDGQLREVRAELIAAREAGASGADRRRLERRLASAEEETRAARARAEELSQALASREAGPAPQLQASAVQVKAAVGVRRWDPRGGWRRLRRGATLRSGDIVAGEGLQGRVQLAGRQQRLSPQLYVVAEGQLQPLPAAVARAQGALPTGTYRAREPRSRRGAGLFSAVSPR